MPARPVSAAGLTTNFCKSLNLGCAESAARPSMTHSAVVRKAPACLALDKARTLSA